MKKPLSKAMAHACYHRDDWKCRHCGNRNDLHPHHIIFRSQQGLDELDNLLTLCWKCHRAVHDGFLKVLVVEVCSKFEGSYTVTFERLKGWKP